MRIDLNADLGESQERWDLGVDLALLQTVTSANVCCGAYAGDESLMRLTCAAAVEHGVAIGAQIGYRDRANFGRHQIDLPAEQLIDELLGQVALLQSIAQSVGGAVTYVKPHGALYNRIVSDTVQAHCVAETILRLPAPLPLMGLPGSISLKIAETHGITVWREGFADRGYSADGTLIARTEPGALLEHPAAVAHQARRLLHAGVDSVCVHSDTPGALELARTVRTALEAEGATVQAS